MAEKSLFYNALADASSPTGYDRNYNADDISDWLDVVMSTGVIKSNTGLKVTPAGGLSVSVDVGKAVINGKPYRNDAAKVFTIDTAPTGSGSRIDFIVLRFDRNASVRNTYLAYKKGTGTAAPALIRTDLIYELALAKITVAPYATEISAAAVADLRGDTETVVTTTTGQSRGYCPYMTAAKGYDDYYDAIVLEYKDAVTMATGGATLTFNIPQYGWTGVDIVTVYTNGIRERESAYTISGNVVTFAAAKAAGTVVEVVVHKFIDGEGLGTVLEQYKELQALVLTLSNTDKYKYICNGVNDNIALSQIAQAFHAGTYDAATITQAAADFLEKWGGAAGLAALASDAFIKIDVFGTFKASAPYAGAGTSTNGYQWLALGRATDATKRLVFDFSAVEKMVFPCTSGARHILFYGRDVHVIGANVYASNTAAGTIIRAFDTSIGRITAERCKFDITAYQDSYISTLGTFTNCRGSVANMINNCYCFQTATAGILRINGGDYFAYTAATSGVQCAVVGQSGADSVSLLYGMNAPTVERSGFTQISSVIQFAGGGVLSCTDLVSALPLVVVAGISNIRGTIVKSKPISI